MPFEGFKSVNDAHVEVTAIDALARRRVPHGDGREPWLLPWGALDMATE
jgi:hypothetical protein